ncbi:methyl-accepting chemotaxis protein [Enterobacter hormaechei]|uniref:methyl-accepting chemotaxis protein n=1 Tax=Enterobacter hormaechei TaxID=158836 RepID=UPI0032DBDA7C
MLKNFSVRSIIVFLLLFLFFFVLFAVCFFSNLVICITFITITFGLYISLACIYLNKFLVSPINRVVSALSVFNEGDFALKIPEFGNNCAGRIIPGINSLSIEITGFVSGIRNCSRATLDIAGKLSEQSFLLTTGAERQSTMLMQTAASMEQISAGTKQSLDSSRELHKITTSSYSSASHGKGIMEGLSEKMESINSCAAKMSEVISIIDDIAFQTNILALNAAVEAARAGISGKGFSVVASEVRGLSHKTAESAKSIKSLIEMTHDNISQGARLVLEARANMSEILSGAEKIEQLTGSVKLATSEQEKGVCQIAQALSELEKVNQTNVVVVEELSMSSTVLGTVANELDRKTSHIKLGSC